MASEACASIHPFVLLESKKVRVVTEEVGVKGEVASDAKTPAESTGIVEDETASEQCGLSDTLETPAEGPIQENETVEGGEGKERAYGGLPVKSPEATVEREGSEIAEAEGSEDAPTEARGETANENSSSNNASDAAPDAKKGIEVGGCTVENQPLNEANAIDCKVDKWESIKGEDIEDAAKETIQAKLSEEEELIKSPGEDLSEETVPTIVFDTSLAEGKAAGENGAKEQTKDGRAGAETEEKLIVEDAANLITEAEETEQVADSTAGAGNHDQIEHEIPTLEPPNASGATEDEPIGIVGLEQKEKPETDTSAERIVREIVEAERRDSAVKPSATTVVLKREEGNACKEQANGRLSGKLMSRVKRSLGKARKAIVGRPSPSSKTIVVNARLGEKVQ